MKLGTLANQSMYLTSLSLYRVVYLWNSSPHQGIGYLIPNQVSDDAGTQKIIDAKRKLDPNFGKYEYSKSEQREKKDQFYKLAKNQRYKIGNYCMVDQPMSKKIEKETLYKVCTMKQFFYASNPLLNSQNLYFFAPLYFHF